MIGETREKYGVTRDERMKLAMHHNRPDNHSFSYRPTRFHERSFPSGSLTSESERSWNPSYFAAYDGLMRELELSMGEFFTLPNIVNAIAHGFGSPNLSKLRSRPAHFGDVATSIPEEIYSALHTCA